MPADRPAAQERGEGIRRWTLCEEIRDGAMTWRVDGPPPDGRNVTVADEQAVCREALREAAEKLRGDEAREIVRYHIDKTCTGGTDEDLDRGGGAPLTSWPT